MIKAIFFDIDGTLVSFKTHQVPASAQRALHLLREQGVKLFIASGRHPKSINNLPGLQFDGYVVVNGTLAFLNTSSGPQVIYRHPIPRSDIHEWLDFIREEPHSTIFVKEDDLRINFIDPTMRQIFELINFPEPDCADLNEWRDEQMLQVISSFSDEDEARLMAHLPHCKTTRWHPLFTDIIPADASKGLGIQAIVDHFGWSPSEVMAFGDGGNDVEMLRMAGTGIALGNAAPDVQAQADYVTTDIDHDGIWNALQHFGLIH